MFEVLLQFASCLNSSHSRLFVDFLGQIGEMLTHYGMADIYITIGWLSSQMQWSINPWSTDTQTDWLTDRQIDTRSQTDQRTDWQTKQLLDWSTERQTDQ